MVVVAVLISVTVLVVVAVVVELNYYSNGSSGPWVFLLLLISCFLGVFFNTSALCRVPFLKKSVKTEEKNILFFHKCFFLRFFYIFRNGTFRELGFFLRCNLCFKNLHLIYQTTL